MNGLPALALDHPFFVDAQNPIADHSLNVGLAAWWLPLSSNQGSGRLFDLGKRYHATLTNGPTWVVEPYGGFGALALDGTDDYAESLTADDALDVTQGTLSAWVYPTSNSGGRTVFAWRVNGSNEVSLYDNNGTASQGLIFQYNAGGTNKVVNVSSLTASSWYHVAMTWSKATDELKGYLNGAQIGTTQTGLGAMTGTPLWLRIGNDAFGGVWSGRLTDLRMHTRAMSRGEVASLYDQSLRGHPNTLNRVRMWEYFDLYESATPLVTQQFNSAWAAQASNLIGAGSVR